MNGMPSYSHARLDSSLMPGIWTPKRDFSRGPRLLEDPGFKFKGGSNCSQVVIPYEVSTLIFDSLKEETDEDKLEDCCSGGDFHAGEWGTVRFVGAGRHQSTICPAHSAISNYLAANRICPDFSCHVSLDGAKSPANVLALKGTLSLKNDSPNFSQVLWVLVYWKGECPADDIDLQKIAGYLWLDITKNPSQSNSSFPVDLVFPHPLAATGCIGLYYGGGPVFAGNATMTADLELTYSPTTSNPNTTVNVGGGEYCFGQDWGCQNATAIDGEAFAVPTMLPASGHLLEIYGNISDSTFDGTNNFGPLPTGASWGTINDFYLLPGGCGIFTENLNIQGFPNPAPLSTLYSWLPKDALHLVSVPQVERIPTGQNGKAALQNQVETIFSVPVKVNAGDCMVAIYGRRGNGATDNETQVLGLMGP